MNYFCPAGSLCSPSLFESYFYLGNTTNLACVNGISVYQAGGFTYGKYWNDSLPTSLCVSGFVIGERCVAPTQATIGTKCSSSVVPNCNCVSGVCTTFPQLGTPTWAIAVLIILGVISLALIGVVIHVCKKLKASESARA